MGTMRPEIRIAQGLLITGVHFQMEMLSSGGHLPNRMKAVFTKAPSLRRNRKNNPYSVCDTVSLDVGVSV